MHKEFIQIKSSGMLSYQLPMVVDALDKDRNTNGFMVKHSKNSGLLELCTSHIAVSSIYACCYLFYSLLKPTGQISFIPNSINQQTWHHTVIFWKVKQISGGIYVLCMVTSVRKSLIPNSCVLHVPAVNYMYKLE